jgi:hypothetical protein
MEGWLCCGNIPIINLCISSAEKHFGILPLGSQRMWENNIKVAFKEIVRM